MLGHRGCRLGVSYPEIYEMQARAVFEGALDAAKETGKAPVPEIMIPLVGTRRELEITRAQIEKVAAEVFAERGTTLHYTIGTMIELPRAAIVADKIAEIADFFSFGTNDLTQTVFGLSRDDAGKFLAAYVEQNILAKDSFVSIDVEGVGAMVQMAAERGRKTKPGLKLGICGEHGGDPASIAFCEQVGLDYVSCSPYRVPVARLAAAQAALGGGTPGRREAGGRPPPDFPAADAARGRPVQPIIRNARAPGAARRSDRGAHPGSHAHRGGQALAEGTRCPGFQKSDDNVAGTGWI